MKKKSSACCFDKCCCDDWEVVIYGQNCNEEILRKMLIKAVVTTVKILQSIEKLWKKS